MERKHFPWCTIQIERKKTDKDNKGITTGLLEKKTKGNPNAVQITLKRFLKPVFNQKHKLYLGHLIHCI